MYGMPQNHPEGLHMSTHIGQMGREVACGTYLHGLREHRRGLVVRRAAFAGDAVGRCLRGCVPGDDNRMPPEDRDRLGEGLLVGALACMEGDRVTIQDKLRVHLTSIVSPIGVPLTGEMQRELIANSDRSQRQAALDRARQRIPFILPDEETEARMWVDGG